MKKLLKSGKEISFLDVDLDFGDGKYYASLRLSRGRTGILEVSIIPISYSFSSSSSYIICININLYVFQASIFTPYSFENKSGFPLCIYTPNHKPPSRYTSYKPKWLN